MIKLRGHHLFCLLGYRGMGYSPEFVENMTALHQSLRENPKIWIELVHGPDQLCEKCPNKGDYHCENEEIFTMDTAVLEKLGLQLGQRVQWAEIESCIKKHVVPSDIQTICKNCSWRTYGVCEEGIQEILAGKGLRKIT